MKIQLSDHFTYGKLLKFTMPSIVMMIFTSIYGVVDGIFVSNFAGKTAFAALNLIWPYVMGISTIGFMVGSGGTALVSKTMGMGQLQKANSIFSMLTWLMLICSAVLSAIAIALMEPVARLLGAEGQMLRDSVVYGSILMIAAPAYITQFAFQSFCVTAEKSNLSLIMTVASGICNIVLDALFVAIFRWGLAGAAVATAIAQYVGAAIPIVYFLRPNKSLLRLGKLELDGKALLRTCANGSSEMVSNLSASLVSMLYNWQLLSYAGEDGLAAYGVMMYVNLIFLAIFIGYAIGSAPLIGYNHGAQNHRELKNVTCKSLVILGVTSVAMAVLGGLMAAPLATIFVGYDETLKAMTTRGFIIYSLSFLLCGLNLFGSSMFTALNNGLISALISFLRTFVFQVAAVLLLPLVWQLDGVWFSIVAAELAALLLTFIFFIAFRKRYHYV